MADESYGGLPVMSGDGSGGLPVSAAGASGADVAGAVAASLARDLLPPKQVEAHARAWLDEDIPSFDYGGAVVGSSTTTEATLWCKSPGVLAGVPFFDAVFAACGCTVEWEVPEGAWLEAGEGPPAAAASGSGSSSDKQEQKGEEEQLLPRVKVATVRGPTAAVLQGERSALNMLARAAGVATVARKAARIAAGKEGFTGKVAGTRKTTPGFRLVEKHAMLVGGADAHRHDLSSMIMLKDNHIWSCGSIAAAVERARRVGGFSMKVEVECQSLERALVALEAGADVIMLDNFKPADLAVAAAGVKKASSHVIVEASGGITLDTLADYAVPNVDVISMGCMTQSVPHVDFSLKVPEPESFDADQKK